MERMKEYIITLVATRTQQQQQQQTNGRGEKI